MPNGLRPSVNDSDVNLWFKIANNLYNYALDFGGSGLNPPSFNDDKYGLIKKSTYYSAVLADLKY